MNAERQKQQKTIGEPDPVPQKRDPQRRHRRSIRLRGYDYSQAGAYFITICTQDRACLFGEIVDGEMRPNAAGRMVKQCWQEIPAHFSHVELDEFVVMPNHVHGILIITNTVGTTHASPQPLPQSSPQPKDEPWRI
jgi:hypothetical protein